MPAIIYYQTRKTMRSAVVLFSGGIDSTTALYWARTKTEQVHALTFDYGQRHRIEIDLCRRLTRSLNVSHVILPVDLTGIGGSALTDKTMPLPEYDRIESIKDTPPATYVPFRNGIFISLAAAWAEVNNIKNIICGFNIIDSPDYPDTSPDFIAAMEAAINQGTKAVFEKTRFSLLAPYINQTKSAIIKAGLAMGADYSFSISCYAGAEIPCNKCSSCLLRKKAWEETGVTDHLLVRLKKEGKI